MQNDLPYFTHKNGARDEPGAKALRAVYGPEGYGRFNILLELISEQPGARLNLGLKLNKSNAALELGFIGKLAEFAAFLDFLADPTECGLIHREGEIIWTDQTDEDFKRVNKKRLRDHDGYFGRGKESENRYSASKNDNSASETGDSASGKDTQHSTADYIASQNNTASKQAGDARPPAVDNLLEELERGGLVLPEADLQRLALRMDSRGLDVGFIAYAIERAGKTPKTKNPKGLAKKGLLEYEDWASEYLASKPVPRAPTLPPPPSCPDCGGDMIHHLQDSEDTRRCVRCKALVYWDRDLKSWEVEDIPQTGAG